MQLLKPFLQFNLAWFSYIYVFDKSDALFFMDAPN